MSDAVTQFPKLDVIAVGAHPDDAEISCGAGAHEEGGECVPDYPELSCAVGTHEESGECVDRKSVV